MSSRSDYLSKYLSGGDDIQDKKKKSKKHKNPKVLTSSNVVIPHRDNWTTSSTKEDDHDEDEHEKAGVNEESPVQVEVKHKNVFKGFKRIDNGNEVASDPLPSKQPLDVVEHQQTVYRDSRGRVIDINVRKQQFETQKKEKDHERTFEEIRTTTESQRQQETTLKKNKSVISDEFEDPLNIFQGEPSVKIEETGSSSQYVYNKGMVPPNRFGIKPGYFWDGIDRSNGFEELALRNQNDKKFKKLESRVNESYGDLDYD